MMIKLKPVTAACLAFAMAAPLSVQAAELAPWTTFQGNAAHTGYVPVALDPSQFALSWQTTLNDKHLGLQPVTVANGMVYASQQGNFSDQGFYVLNAKDGKKLWGVKFSDTYWLNPPAYDNGLVYIQTVNSVGDSWLRAYEAASGTHVFKAAQGAQWNRYMAPTIVDRTVYVDGGTYGGMYSFSGVTGGQNWFIPLAPADLWTPAVDANYAYVYVENLGLQAFSRPTGELAFTIEGNEGSYIHGGHAPVLGGMNDVVVIGDGRLASFDLAKRMLNWVVMDGFGGQPAVANGVIYVVNNGTLSARSEQTGAQVWMWKPEGEALSGPVVVTDSHVFVSGSANTYAVDLATHKSTWSYGAHGSLAWSEGALYIASGNGVLSAISTGNVGVAGADLKLSLKLKPQDGDDHAFRLAGKIWNKGPQDSGSAKLKVNVPGSFAVKHLDEACEFSDKTVTCAYANLVSGLAQEVSIDLIANKSGNFAVSASVKLQRFDPVPANNQVTLQVQVP